MGIHWSEGKMGLHGASVKLVCIGMEWGWGDYSEARNMHWKLGYSSG